MARASLKLEGTPALKRALKRMEAEVAAETLKGVLDSGARVIRDDARDRAPRSGGSGHGPDGGHLADNIETDTRVFLHAAESRIGPTQSYWYGVFPEFGTKQDPAGQPYLRPAWDSRIRQASARIQDGVRKRLLLIRG